MSDVFGSVDLFSAFSGGDPEQESGTYDENTNGMDTEELVNAKEMADLRAENLRLKSRIRLHERFGHLFPSQTPLAEVDYFKSPLSTECQSRIESELYTILSENRDTTEENGPENQYDSYGHVLYLPYYIIDSVGKFWDKTPVQYGDNTPLFTSVFSVALDDGEDKLDMFGAKLPKQNMANGPTCFNCDGPHRLSDCKLPHDKKKIQEGLKQFKESRGGPNHNDRYHVRVVKEIEARFKEFQPGKVSDSLRLALGLENHELAPHIYRMRNFGYPPGYSLDPPLSTSEGMQFYAKPTTSITQEDGEIAEAPLPAVVEYPGYTTAPASDVIDKHQPRNPVYSNATPTLSDKRKPRADQTNKRRKMDHTLGGKDEDDMEVDDDKETKPAHDRQIIQQPPPPPPMPEEPAPSAPSPPPLPPGLEELAAVTPAKSKLSQPAATSTPVPEKEKLSTEEMEEEGEIESETRTETESSDIVGDDKSAAGEPLNRSIVSETNKIGIKFDQIDDFGPLDERAGNFTKLQCILRSRKKSVGSTPSKPPPNTRKKRNSK
ncbi:zinc finger CCHC domain-containing protein 8-like [Bolinopsis microptera]|uniref:zinc finger CCHC domain-containing protein 8-like n=1 Tax=Bolinopsis microptera TaxID=2820187 RepID=UPI003078F98B